MYIFNVAQIGLVGVFLFDDQFNTRIDPPHMLRKDLQPSLISIDDGQIHIVRRLKASECEGEFQNQESGRKYMKLHVDKIHRKVYFDEFYSFPYEEIVRLLSEGKKVCRDLLLSCFMKQTDKVAAIIPLMMRDSLICGFASLCSPDNTKNVFCVPVETEQYPKDHWYYKMTFAPIQDQMKVFAASLSTYTDDICSMINDGRILLVDKQEYSEKLNQAAEEMLKQLQKRRLFKKKIKGAEMLRLPAYYNDGVCGITAVQATLLDEEIACIITGDSVA